MNLVYSLKQLIFLTKHYIFCEVSSWERFYSPVLFAATILVIFNFAFADSLPKESLSKIFLAEVFVALLFAVQISFMRMFDLDTEDGALEVMRSRRLSSASIFLSKYTVTFLSACLMAVPIVFLAFFFHLSGQGFSGFWGTLFLILFLVLGGLSALGSLVSSVLQKVSSREVLYPLLFYPLCSPLFIVGLQVANMSLEGKEVSSLLFVLLGLDFLYLALGILLFDELIT